MYRKQEIDPVLPAPVSGPFCPECPSARARAASDADTGVASIVQETL